MLLENNCRDKETDGSILMNPVRFFFVDEGRRIHLFPALCSIG